MVVGYILLIVAATITKSGSVLMGSSSAAVTEGVFGMPHTYVTLASTLLSLGSQLDFGPFGRGSH